MGAAAEAYEEQRSSEERRHGTDGPSRQGSRWTAVTRVALNRVDHTSAYLWCQAHVSTTWCRVRHSMRVSPEGSMRVLDACTALQGRIDTLTNQAERWPDLYSR